MMGRVPLDCEDSSAASKKTVNLETTKQHVIASGKSNQPLFGRKNTNQKELEKRPFLPWFSRENIAHETDSERFTTKETRDRLHQENASPIRNGTSNADRSINQLSALYVTS